MDLKAAETEIPCFDFTQGNLLVQGSDGWKNLSNKVREACEEYGCFQVVYNGIPTDLHEEVFKVVKELFDLPDETKQKNKGSMPYTGYIGKNALVPLYESLGIQDAHTIEGTEAFAKLMWPDGNLVFCQAVNSVSRQLYELGLLIVEMIMESYGVDKEKDSYVESSGYLCRVMRYDAPANDSEIALTPHKDKNGLTILFSNSVQGLEVYNPKGGNWVQVVSSLGKFTVLIGEALRAWSNGRLDAAKHRVVMSEDKTRYSFGWFLTPKEGAVIEAAKELVDGEHPQLFRPFNYRDFVDYVYSSRYKEEETLEAYAGV